MRNLKTETMISYIEREHVEKFVSLFNLIFFLCSEKRELVYTIWAIERSGSNNTL